jgi:RHS repeat-associated protein
VYEPESHVPVARLDAKAEPAQASATAQVFHFHNDTAGLPEELSNNEGQLCWRASYRTWGATVTEQWEVTALNGRAVASSGTVPQAIEQNLRFQGQYLDRDTGLHYNTFRFYDPDIGRFISPDPIGLAGGDNLHSYSPNPIGWIDPLGLSPDYPVSANTALPDVQTRGIHVNVGVPNGKPIHVGLRPDHVGGVGLVPADPRARAIAQKNPAQWSRIQQSVNTWLQNPSNAKKMADTAGAAKSAFRRQGAEFAHLERNLKKGIGC